MIAKKRIMQIGGAVTLATVIALLATPAMGANEELRERQKACLDSGGVIESQDGEDGRTFYWCSYE
jgi:hypothetical protein